MIPTSYTSMTVYNDLQAIARERANKYEYDFTTGFGDYTSFEEKVFLGQLSWTATRTRRRILSKSSAKQYISEVWQTPTEIARDYLDVAHPRPLRCTREQRETFNIERSAPLYYEPAIIPSGCYVDVQSAYLQILDVIGWDCDYFPRKYLSAGRPPSDFPLRHDKISRNSLVTSGLNSTVSVWTGYKLIETSPRNIHINLGLWCAIQDILHAIARRAYSFGAKYINTDGFILPDGQAQAFQEYLTEAWKIKTEVKHYGQCYVSGVGRYRVGEKSTKGFGVDFQAPYCNINFSEDDEMLQKTYRSMATNRIDKPYLTVLDLA
jgi:hypothetical protein